MTLPALHHLPVETLNNIASCIDGSPGPDVSSFALVCRACNAAAAYLLFREVHIRLTNPASLQRDVKKWLDVLSRNSRKRHVRRLDVRFEFVTISPRPWRFNHPHPRGQDWQFDRRIEYETRLQFRAPGSWDALVKMLEALPSLRELAIDHDTSFARQLVEVLETRHAKCQLDLRRFNMLPLYVATGDQDPIDRHDVALLLTPQLHGISVDEYNHDDHSARFRAPLHVNEVAVRELLLAGLAPRLETIDMRPNIVAGRGPGRHLSVESYAHQFRELLSQEPKNQPSHRYASAMESRSLETGSLTSLTLCTSGVTRIEDWLEAAGTTSLRRLKLLVEFNDYTLLRKKGLPSLGLTELELHFNHLVSRQQNWKKKFPEVPTLTHLSLIGSVSPSIFDVAIFSFGKSLRILKLSLDNLKPRIEPRPAFVTESLTILPEGCPMLQELVIENCDVGNGADWSVCKSLGQNQRLRKLCVELGTSTEDKTLATTAWHVIKAQGCSLEYLLVNGYIEVQRAGFGDYEALTVQLKRDRRMRKPQGGREVLKALADGGPTIPCDPVYRPLNCSVWDCAFRYEDHEGCSQWGHIGETEMRMIEEEAERFFS